MATTILAMMLTSATANRIGLTLDLIALLKNPLALFNANGFSFYVLPIVKRIEPLLFLSRPCLLLLLLLIYVVLDSKNVGLVICIRRVVFLFLTILVPV